MEKTIEYKGITFIVNDDGTTRTPAYEVTYTDGRVYHYPEKELKWYKDHGGYMFSSIERRKDGIPTRINIKQHRLVAMAFIPNPQNLPEVNHKDEDKTNNSVDNLEWCNASYNINYGTRNQRANEKKYNRGSKLMPERPVVQMDMNGEIIKEYSSIREATRETGVEHSCICRCCTGSRNAKTAGGFKWAYM